MPLSKIQAESMNLADTYAFTGTVSGAGNLNLVTSTTISSGASSAIFDISAYDVCLLDIVPNYLTTKSRSLILIQ